MAWLGTGANRTNHGPAPGGFAERTQQNRKEGDGGGGKKKKKGGGNGKGSGKGGNAGKGDGGKNSPAGKLASHTRNGEKLCGAFNGKKGCKKYARYCPQGAMHRCGVITGRDGSVCYSTKHGANDHEH